MPTFWFTRERLPGGSRRVAITVDKIVSIRDLGGKSITQVNLEGGDSVGVAMSYEEALAELEDISGRTRATDSAGE